MSAKAYTAGVETVAWSSDAPWRGFGFETTNDRTPKQMCADSKTNWKTEKVPLYFKNKKGEEVLWEDTSGLIRATDEYQLSGVGTGYKDMQNEEAAEFFSEFVKAGDMKMETMGSLWNGRYVWALASIQKSLKVDPKGKDVLGGYILMALPHFLGSAIIFKFVNIRNVCWNTFNATLFGKASGGMFKMSHATTFDDIMKERAKDALGLATEQFSVFVEQARLLAKVKQTQDEAHKYFCEVFEFDEEAAKKNKNGEIRIPKQMEQVEQALLHAPGQQLGTAAGTLWGSFNAITYGADHMFGKSDELRMRRAWFGNAAKLKQRALDVALVRAKAA